MRTVTTLLLFLLSTAVYSQSGKRTASATRTQQAPKIDGELNDDCWKNATVISGFTETRPTAGARERDEIKTIAYLVYDNTAIYVAAHMYDVTADSIRHELRNRDEIGSTDFFAVFIDSYNERQTGYGFFVSAAGVQLDARYTNITNNNNEDFSWNGVWESNAKIKGNEWMCELKIPYSALRFSHKEVQTWTVNFMRKRDALNQQLFWNHVDPKVNGFITQWGEITNLQNIIPPLRLSFTPYTSFYVDNYPYNTPGIKNTSARFNGGMDLKYGINESFTLDMTLIPDFGQVQSDNRVLNLTPFEIRYNENRSFFTEGTELFNKGNFFYSRRIGGQPVNYNLAYSTANANETVIKNPSESKLINAAKVSGRTRHGLGIGIFNAITNTAEATLEGENGQQRKIRTQPYTNYNILVFDQALKNSSSVTLLNTNVLRSGSTYDANVTAGLFTINNKKNTYYISGKGATSTLYNYTLPGVKNLTGYHYQVSGGKSSGNFTWTLLQTYYDKRYNPNDMGILFSNNEINNEFYASYGIFKPSSWFTEFSNGGGAVLQYRNEPRRYQSSYVYLWNFTRFKNSWILNINADYSPGVSYDFYEARDNRHIYKLLPTGGLGIYIQTNTSKKYWTSLNLFGRNKERFDANAIDIYFSQNYRFNDHLSTGFDIFYGPRNNFAGYVATVTIPGKIIFGRYDRNTLENILYFKYTFNNRMGITARARHYFSRVRYKSFYTLLDDGDLMPGTEYNQNSNINYNLFNVDFVYAWRFAPGSEFNVVWKNNIGEIDNILIKSYFTNLDNTLSAKQLNSISIKLLYYIDYMALKKRL